MRSHLARRKLLAATPTAFHPRPRWAATFNFRTPAAGSRRPLGAYREVRAHVAPSKLGTAAPTAFHSPPTWAANEIEGGVLLKLPHTNLTPTLATALREAITAERQIRAVVLRKVNVLAAAQTDVSNASRMVSVIEQAVLGRGILQLIHFTAGLERKPAFPSCWRTPESIAGTLRGVWLRANWRARPFPLQLHRLSASRAQRRPEKKFLISRFANLSRAERFE